MLAEDEKFLGRPSCRVVVAEKKKKTASERQNLSCFRVCGFSLCHKSAAVLWLGFKQH